MRRPPRITEPAPREGSRKLLEHIRANYPSIPAFAEQHKLARQTVERAIDGRLQRIDVAFAAAVKEATGGAVLIEDWALESDPSNDPDPTLPGDSDKASTLTGFGKGGRAKHPEFVDDKPETPDAA